MLTQKLGALDGDGSDVFDAVQRQRDVSIVAQDGRHQNAVHKTGPPLWMQVGLQKQFQHTVFVVILIMTVSLPCY